MKREAVVTNLSTSTNVVLSFNPSGGFYSLSFLRGREAFTLSEPETRNLRKLLAVEPEGPDRGSYT